MAAAVDSAHQSPQSRLPSSQCHKPKHMRWRDKVKYLEKEASSRSSLKQEVERSSSSDTSHVVPAGGVRVASVTDRRRSASDAPVGFHFGNAIKGAAARDGEQEFKAGNVMRWRDKVSYLEKEGSRRRSMTGEHQSPRPSNDDVKSPTTIPEGKGDDDSEQVTGRQDSKSKKTYSHTFTHHPPHTRLRDKMHILASGGSNLTKEQVAS